MQATSATLAAFGPMLRTAADCFDDGNRHLAAGELAQARDCFRQAVALAPDLGEAHANLGWILAATGEHAQADACYERALALRPQTTQIALNYGAHLARTGRPRRAEQVYRRALAADGQSAALRSNLAALQAQLGRFDAAEASCREALALAPGHAKAHFNLSYLCLRDGRLEEGWRHFEARPSAADRPAPVLRPRWQGEPLQGHALLVAGEGGHGDMIQFIRYVALLKRQGARRIGFICPPALRALLASQPGLDELRPWDEPVDPAAWDVWTPLMSLPGLLGTRIDTIPASLPYLSVDDSAVRAWQAAVPAGGLRVGVTWQGNPKFENDADRSLPGPALLAPLARMDGVRLVSLQIDAEGAAVAGPAWLHAPTAHARVGSFADTAAIVRNLDLVISVDTAVAHLAGALGTPCWVLLPRHMTDWRWCAEGSTSPWYPGVMRLFRQRRRGDWAPVVAQLAAALAGFVRARSDCTVVQPAAPEDRQPAAASDRVQTASGAQGPASTQAHRFDRRVNRGGRQCDTAVQDARQSSAGGPGGSAR